MKNLILLIAVFAVNFGYAQTTAQVDQNPRQDFDIVLIPFGIEHPVKVGTLDKMGKVTLSGKMDFTQVPESKQNEYMLQMSEVLDFCDNSEELLDQSVKTDAAELGLFMLWGHGEIAGFITLVSDTALFDWASGQGEGNPVVGSVFELIYVDTGFDFLGACKGTFDVGSDKVTTEFKVDVHFKPGLNFMQYEIQSISRPVTEGFYRFPERVRITSHTKPPQNVIWMAYYY